jgi:Domain of unknown function (DUF4440)
MKETGWLLILACTGLLSVRAQEGSAVSATRAILALEHTWSDAESHGDQRTLERIFDNALVYIEDGRLMTKGECLSRLRLTGVHPRQIDVGTAVVHIFGSTAIVVGTYREIGAKDGKTLLKRWRFIDTWVNKSGSWMLVAAGSSPLTN